jgi:hypothetical protein
MTHLALEYCDDCNDSGAIHFNGPFVFRVEADSTSITKVYIKNNNNE